MGYDLELVNPPEEYPADYEPQNEDCPECFRIGSGSRGSVGEAMAAAGVLDLEQPSAEFPKWPPPGIDDERGRKLMQYMDDGEALRRRLEPHEVAPVERYVRNCETV